MVSPTSVNEEPWIFNSYIRGCRKWQGKEVIAILKGLVCLCFAEKKLNSDLFCLNFLTDFPPSNLLSQFFFFKHNMRSSVIDLADIWFQSVKEKSQLPFQESLQKVFC